MPLKETTSERFSKLDARGATFFQIKVCGININPHMHKIGPQGHKYYISGDHLYSKNARKLKFHVFLRFNARNPMMSSLYLKWAKFTRDCEFLPI